MTKAAVMKEEFGNRKSFGKNETPNKQKGLNAVAKTPNSAMKQIKTPKSGSKPQTNPTASSPAINITGKLSRSQRRRLQKKRKKELLKMQQGTTPAKKTPNSGFKKEMKPQNEDDEDDDEDEEDSEGLEEEEDSDDGEFEEADTDDDELDEEGGEEEEDSDEDDSEDEDDDEEDEDDSVLADGNEAKKAKGVKKEEESEDDEDDDEDEEDDDEDDDDDEEEEKVNKKDSVKKEIKKEAAKQPAKKQMPAADKTADQKNFIFLGNLDFKIEKQDVENFIREKLSPKDLDHVEFLPKIAGRARGYCFAKLTNEAAVEKAMKLNGTEWHGRALKVGLKTTGARDKVKYIRISNISNKVNDGQILELLTSVIKLNEITSFKRVRSNIFGTQGAVQLQLTTDESYKKLQKLNNSELGGNKIEVSETTNKLKSTKGEGVVKQPKKSQNPNKGNRNRNQGNQNKGNAQQKGGRYFKNNDESKNRKRPGNNAGGNNFKKIKKE